MRLVGYKFIWIYVISVLCWTNLHGQHKLLGRVLDENGDAISSADIFEKSQHSRTSTDASGDFVLDVPNEGTYEIITFALGYEVLQTNVLISGSTTSQFRLKKLSYDLSEVVILDQKEQIFNLKRLNPVEGTAIYAGKKSEVVLLDQMVGNKAANNARQVYAQVVGLNIYEGSDAGLQLNIGGRGLDPNRTSNFNTRQNGYDISADVLGYPESYYTPPAEALSEIQVVRGAASLQYGTQFGGLVNFKMKKPNRDKNIELTSRQSIGSFGLFSSFNSLEGTKGKFSYYTYFQRKQGNGFRPNSDFHSNNAFAHFGYQLNDKTKISLEYTYLNYLAQQAGGLTDGMFAANPEFSNRSRNWFEVNWHLGAVKVEHKLTPNNDLSVMLFGLNAGRNALGFRGNPVNLNANPVTAEDATDEFGNYIFTRDLIKGDFKNYGAEVRFLSRYTVSGKNAVFLLGSKFYKSSNSSIQGPGSIQEDANFDFQTATYPDYPSQSEFEFPNLNVSLFGENIFVINDQFSLTPGFRLEHIRTESLGTYNEVVFDNAENPIANVDRSDNRSLSRSFVLLGVGASYTPSDKMEIYGNISQNYRSITFSDIRVVSPSFIVDPGISDEEGYTMDVGMRGRGNDIINYDISLFSLLYNDRIGIILDDRANRVRKNIGKALIYGLEVFADFNILKALKADSKQAKLNVFVNTALTESEYLESEENNVKGKKVEFIPRFNFKTGLNFGYRNLVGSLQWLTLSQQFTDVENSSIPQESDSRSGVVGEIPGYNVMDFSLSYKWKNFKLESGINNVFDSRYFTRRATGYPGPGIIPSDPRSFYITLELKL